MLQIIREFRIRRPQIFAGLLLLAFLAQCLWVARERHFSELEYEYLASGYSSTAGHNFRISSPFTGVVAAMPLRGLAALRHVVSGRTRNALAIPRPWLLRLPFVIFGVWLGAAVWWVARRLFGDNGGYVALALYCFSPAMVTISSNVGPEIILAWSSFGLVYTAIGVAHTVYAPAQKWLPRIIILGTAIGVCLSTTLWSFTLVLLAFAFMLYLTPQRRRQVLLVLAGASVIGLMILVAVRWITGNPGIEPAALLTPQATSELIHGLAFVFVDADLPAKFDAYRIASYLLPALFVIALTVYGSWPRARYFGNTAPLITAFASVFLLASVPALYLWNATIGLSFAFLFIAGVAADLLETPQRRPLATTLVLVMLVKAAWGFRVLSAWIQPR